MFQSFFLLISLYLVTFLVAQPTLTRSWITQQGVRHWGYATHCDGTLVTFKFGEESWQVSLLELNEEDQSMLRTHFQLKKISLNTPSPSTQNTHTGQIALPRLPKLPQISGTLLSQSERLEYDLGKVNFCEITDSDEYYFYIPNSLHINEKYSCLFITDISTGNIDQCREWIQSAEENQTILIYTPRMHDGGLNPSTSRELGKKVVEDVLEKFDIDPKRIYFAGFKEGAKVAFALACQFDADGVIAIESGFDIPRQRPHRDLNIYYLCGTNSYKRWEVATCSALSAKTNQTFLSFYKNTHHYPPQKLLDNMMLLLNSAFLVKNHLTYSEQLARHEHTVLDNYLSKMRTNPWQILDFSLQVPYQNFSAPLARYTQQLIQYLQQKHQEQHYGQETQSLESAIHQAFALGAHAYQTHNAFPASMKIFNELKESLHSPHLKELCEKLAAPATLPLQAK